MNKVIKAFFSLGFTVHYSKDTEGLIEFYNVEEMSVIKVNLKTKRYMKVDSVYYTSAMPISFQEHQLITELFNVVEVKDEA